MEENELNEQVIHDTEPVINNMPPEEQPPVKDKKWLKYAGILLLTGFCMPVVGLIYEYVPKIFIVIAAAVLLIFIIKAINEREKGRAVIRETSPENIETCSDIKALNLNLSGATFVINQGLNFSINGSDERNFKSYVKDGIWHIESVKKTNKINPSADAYPVTISLPQSFNAEKATIRLTGAKLLMYGLSAYRANLITEGSETDIRNIYAKTLDIRLIGGDLRANAKTDGNINLRCFKGKAYMNLGCHPDSINCKAAVKNGRIAIDDMSAQHGSIIIDNHSQKELNMTCEGGEAVVVFRQEAVSNA